VGEPSSGTIRDRVVAGRAAVANRVDVASRRGRLGGSSLGAWRVASPRETRRFGGGTRIRTGVQGIPIAVEREGHLSVQRVWLAFGLLVGPVVGFLLGARSWRDLWISVQAGLLFTLPLSVMIAATRLIPPRWIGKRPVDDLRGFVRLRAPRSGRSPSRRWRWCALSDEIERRRLQGMISQESRALISRRARCRCPSRCC